MTNRGPTAEEIAALIAADLQRLAPRTETGALLFLRITLAANITAALKEAIAGENERAAKIAETMPRHDASGFGYGDWRASTAKAIRNLPPEHQDEGK